MRATVEEIKAEFLKVSKEAGQTYFDHYLQGHDRGMCGFAWVNVCPGHKGNTKEGRAERKVLRELGFELDWTGKVFSFWDPSGLPYQNIDAKHAGAAAGAEYLRTWGFKAYAGSRLD